MSPFLYALNIGTLATWLTVASASTVACVIHVVERLPGLNDGKADETEVFITPMSMGSAPPAAPSESSEETAAEEVAAQDEIPELPEMPEVPELAELEPLPDVPDLPELPPVRSSEGTERPKPAAAKSSTQRPKAGNRTTAGGSTSGHSGQGTGQGNGTARGSGDSPVGADRWNGLRKVKPTYPSVSKRNGEIGQVVVLFTVDERGYVISASITKPCKYPALNEAALASVRRFKAKPGARATGSQTVVFQLN